MTVKELIERLQTMPPDLRVFGAVDFNDILGVRIQTEGDWPVEHEDLPIVLLHDGSEED